MRFGIAQRALLGMMAPAALVGLALVLGLERLHDFHVRFDRLSQVELPSLMRAHELERETTRMTGLSAEIVTAPSDQRLKGIRDQMNAALATGMGLIPVLSDGAASAEAQELADRLQVLGGGLNALIALRGGLLELEAGSQRIYRALADLAVEINQDPADLAAADDARSDWNLHINQALSQLYLARDAQDSGHVALAENGFERSMKGAEHALDRGPPELHRPASLKQAALLGYGAGPAGLFALRTRQIELNQALKRALAEVQPAAAALVGSSRALYEKTRNTVTAHDIQAQLGMTGFRHALIGIGLLTLLFLLWAYLFVRRSLIRRILVMQGILNANIGREHSIPTPVEGDDELTEMAREVNYFLGEIKRREQALRHAAEREQAASRARGQFLANVSHEIRTPLNSIINLTALCLYGDLSEPQRDRLRTVERSAAGLLALTNGILDFSRIDAGRLELEKAPFRLDELLQALSSQAEEMAHKGVTFRLECAPDLPAVVHGDALRIRQVLQNLVGNAIKFTYEGSIVVRVGVVDQESDAWRIGFEVEDTGIGIAAEHQGRIFDLFEQADPDISRRYGGAGLGLAIVRRLADAMGGTLEVASEPGRGSRFSVILPLPPAQADAAPAGKAGEAAVAHEQELAGALVLLVEDNPFNQQVAQELLAGAGAMVELAENGFEAVEMAGATDYDLILMDLQMPGMDGLVASRSIRALPERGDIPIIAVTADTLPDTRAQCLAAGMNDLIVKPIEIHGFYATLLRWLRSGEDDEVGAMPPADAGSSAGDQVGGGLVETDNAGLLALFERHHSDTPRRLREALGSGDIELAHRLAHNLKSAAATIRAETLQEEARIMEALLKAALSAGRTSAVGEGRIDALIDSAEGELVAVLERARTSNEPEHQGSAQARRY